jgi:hypothetical protein
MKVTKALPSSEKASSNVSKVGCIMVNYRVISSAQERGNKRRGQEATKAAVREAAC